MRTLTKYLVLIIGLAALTGCNASNPNRAMTHAAIAADAVSTYQAVNVGKVTEANPLLPKTVDAAGAAIVSAAMSYGFLKLLCNYRPELGSRVARRMTAIKLGTAVNNHGIRKDKDLRAVGLVTAGTVYGTQFAFKKRGGYCK